MGCALADCEKLDCACLHQFLSKYPFLKLISVAGCGGNVLSKSEIAITSLGEGGGGIHPLNDVYNARA